MAPRREIVLELVVGRLWLTVLLGVLLGGLVLASAVWAAPHQGARRVPLTWVAIMPGRYYLTASQHLGDDALGACAEGYHMASLWEIWDVSNLYYDTDLGYCWDDAPLGDCGEGPPAARAGWVRTGADAVASGVGPGGDSCIAYTSPSGSERGTVASLPSDWSSPPSTMGVWVASNSYCDSPNRVWCVRSALRSYLPLTLRNY
ncbi:MAG: hypothetical protein GTO63_18625 [Anaerolineae bacterium]|nr:hypothetical protein [Anaerolineae bacterium]NIN96785.1 hypothetical protein [Anaerolineae bacterium]NIQ79781.1 hypothetical protein [Anaerolineae bacterium]